MGPLLAAAGISALTGAAQGISQIVTSAQQRKRAEELRAQADKVIAPDIPRQYLEADKIKQWQATHGMPGYGEYKQDLASNTSDSIQAAEGASGSGSNTLAAISALYGNQNRATNDLNARDAEYRDRAVSGVAQSREMLGNVATQNQAIKRAEQDKIRTAASQLENAGEANRQAGVSGITGSIGKGIAGGLGVAAADQQDASDKANGVGKYGTTTVTNPNGTTTTTAPAVQTPAVQPAVVQQPNIQNVASTTPPAAVDGYAQALQSMGRTGAPDQLDPANASADDLMRIQQHLNSKGLYTGPIDGTYNPELEDALKNFNAGPVNTNLGAVAPLYKSAY